MKSRMRIWSTAAALVAVLTVSVGMAAQDNPSPNHHRHHTYTLVDLGTFGGPNSYPIITESVQTLSQNGVVGGCAETTEGNPKFPNFNPFLFPPPGPDPLIAHTFQWRNGLLTDLGALPGTNTSCALWISGNGLIAGASETGATDPLAGFPAAQAVLWRNNSLVSLGTLGGYESFAISVNDRGQAVGASTNTIPEDNGLGDQLHATLWENGRIRDLGTLPGGTDSFAVVVNDRGQVMGASTASPQPGSIFFWENGVMRAIPNTIGGTGENPFFMNNRAMILGNAGIAGDIAFHPFIWYRGVMTDIGTFGGDNGDAVWVNELGQVVGTADLPGDVMHHAYLWQRGHKADLAPLPGDLCSTALAINESGQVVGRSSDCTNGVASIWENGRVADLNQLVEPGSGLNLIRAWNINDRGEIVGEALLDNGDEHAFLLKPHGDCDYRCEQRLAEHPRDRMAAAQLARPQTLATKTQAPVTSAERVRNLLRQRFGLTGPNPALRD